MRKRTVIILVAVFASGILLGLYIPRLLKKETLRPSPLDFISGYLSLSKSQRKRMESLDRSFYARVEKMRTELRQRRAELSEFLGESPSSEKEITNKVSEIASLQVELQRETINHLVEIRSLLTPEQQTKFFSLIRKRLHPGRPWKGYKKGRF